MTDLAPTPYQQVVLKWRPISIANCGGRGAGKTWAMLIAVIDHCREHGASARPLVLRESWLGLQSMRYDLLELCHAAFGGGVRQNKSEQTITLPEGGIITLSNVGDERQFIRHQGATYTGIFADEVGAFSPGAWRLFKMVRSNLRTSPGKKTEQHITANPHGSNHSAIAKEFVNMAPAFTPFIHKDGSPWIWASGNIDQNPHLDIEAYKKQLVASTHGQPELAKAWIEGSWAVLAGCMFSVFDSKHHVIPYPTNADMIYRTGADWGTASPSAAILLGRLRQPHQGMAYGSIIALDEYSTSIDDTLEVGSGAAPASVAEEILKMNKDNGVRAPWCVIDNARGLAGADDTVVKLFNAAGLTSTTPHKKSRSSSWALISEYLANAITGDGPGLYFTPKVKCLLETLPEVPRGRLNAEDTDPAYRRDHWLDSLAYGMKSLVYEVTRSGHTVGLY